MSYVHKYNPETSLIVTPKCKQRGNYVNMLSVSYNTSRFISIFSERILFTLENN